MARFYAAIRTAQRGEREGFFAEKSNRNFAGGPLNPLCRGKPAGPAPLWT